MGQEIDFSDKSSVELHPNVNIIPPSEMESAGTVHTKKSSLGVKQIMEVPEGSRK
jgi:hypothetical protein